MARIQEQERTQQQRPPQQAPNRGAVAVLHDPRLPYPADAKELFEIDKAQWLALVEAVWPAAQTSQAVFMALSYCKARKLDPFKRVIHIVPVWSRQLGKMVETVWPGIGELRTTAFRTGTYAGKSEVEFGPEKSYALGGKTVLVPEWARMTVDRLVAGAARRFVGPKVYWIETYAREGRNSDAPNEMWAKRSKGQLEKCAEAAALRAAFPEELGDVPSAEEMVGQVIDTAGNVLENAPPRPGVDMPARPQWTGDGGGTVTDVSDESEGGTEEPQRFVMRDAHGEEAETVIDPTDALDWLEGQMARLPNPPAIVGFWEHNEETIGQVAAALRELDDAAGLKRLGEMRRGYNAAKQPPQQQADKKPTGDRKPAQETQGDNGPAGPEPPPPDGSDFPGDPNYRGPKPDAKASAPSGDKPPAEEPTPADPDAPQPGDEKYRRDIPLDSGVPNFIAWASLMKGELTKLKGSAPEVFRAVLRANKENFARAEKSSQKNAVMRIKQQITEAAAG
jgi:phage recombination protein Bet